MKSKEEIEAELERTDTSPDNLPDFHFHMALQSYRRALKWVLNKNGEP